MQILVSTAVLSFRTSSKCSYELLLFSFCAVVRDMVHFWINKTKLCFLKAHFELALALAFWIIWTINTGSFHLLTRQTLFLLEAVMWNFTRDYSKCLHTQLMAREYQQNKWFFLRATCKQNEAVRVYEVQIINMWPCLVLISTNVPFNSYSDTRRRFFYRLSCGGHH